MGSARLGLVVLALLAGLAGCQAQQELPRPIAPTPTQPTVHVTADEVAQAMQQDAFFSTYGQDSLLIQGTVVSINRNGSDLIVVLDSAVPTKVECDLGSRESTVQVGETITVLSENPGSDASRDAGMVLLRNCRIPPDA
jgi:hypothetical protein